MIFIVAAVVLFLAVLFLASYVKAPPDKAYIITGLRKRPRVLIGKAGFRLPLFERLDKLSLGAFQVDVKTASSVPTVEFINVKIDSTVSVKISEDPNIIQVAARNFLNVPHKTIVQKINDLLEGNLREIAGSMKLTEMVNNRKLFSEKVQENAVPDLAKLGLELISFNVQNFIDDNGVIADLGIDNVEQIRKQAAIAKSDAQKEISMAEAVNAKEANEMKVASALEIAKRQADLDRERAALKADVDTQTAKAEAAKAIELENQRQLRDVAATNANIAKAEREAELKQRQIELKEYELDAVVRKQADADRYAAEQKAEAERIRREAEARAKAYEIKQQSEAEAYKLAKQAEAQKIKAEADRFAAEQQAAGITAVGLAEAEAIEKKAEAQKKMGEASVLEMYFKAMPQIVSAASGPLENVDKITMYGEGNSAKLVGDVMQTTNKVMEAMAENGIDVKALLAGFMGGKAAN